MSMERRSFLRALLAPVTMVLGDQNASVALDPKTKYILFADPDAIDLSAMAETEAIENVTIIPVRLRGEQTIDDVVRVYQLGEELPCDGDGDVGKPYRDVGTPYRDYDGRDRVKDFLNVND